MRLFKLCLIAFAAFALTLCAFGALIGFVAWNLNPAEWGGGGRALLSNLWQSYRNVRCRYSGWSC